MEYPASRLLVFAREPVPGKVKTRLIPALGARGAVSLHKYLVRTCLRKAVGARLCPVELWCSPGTEHPFFQECMDRFGVTLHAQQGRDLGERMHHALCSALQRGSPAILIGTDCPSLTKGDLGEALAALHGGHDAVLGPAEDGGYYLLGLRVAGGSLFEGIAWGRGEVCGETRLRIARLNWRWHELARRRDVDRPEDVEWLKDLRAAE
jgi:rSAM/selenodomain-associated transferase 1